MIEELKVLANKRDYPTSHCLKFLYLSALTLNCITRKNLWIFYTDAG